jgi:hypothetical protein
LSQCRGHGFAYRGSKQNGFTPTDLAFDGKAVPAHKLFRANPKLFSAEQTAMIQRYQASLQTAFDHIADKKRQKQPRPIKNRVHSRLPVVAATAAQARVQGAPLITNSTSTPVSLQLGTQEEQAGQFTPLCSRSASVASCSTTQPDLDRDFEQMESELHQEFKDLNGLEVTNEADLTALCEKMELLNSRTQNLLILLEDCNENTALQMGLNERAEQNLAYMNQEDMKQQSLSAKIHSVRKEKISKVDDLNRMEAEFAAEREMKKKEIAEKEAEEDGLLDEQSETSTYSMELKADLAFCLHAQKDQIQIMSQDVQAACEVTKKVAATGKAASTLLKRIIEDKEHKTMRDDITATTLNVLSTGFLDSEIEVEKIDNIWITDSFGEDKHGNLVSTTYHKNFSDPMDIHFSDPKDTEAKLSRKLFDSPDIEIDESSAKETEAERQVRIFAAKIFQAKVMYIQFAISIFH